MYLNFEAKLEAIFAVLPLFFYSQRNASIPNSNQMIKAPPLVFKAKLLCKCGWYHICTSTFLFLVHSHQFSLVHFLSFSLLYKGPLT